ncbi:MAG: hypothetical protein NTV51_28595 [Verrucomicrobia bacterium]|nr:hypothetical protein [Verrucomicrobiota bacterium]
MSPRSARLILAALLAATTVVAPAQTPPPAAVPAPGAAPKEDLFTLKLPDADIDTILGSLEQYTGKHILRPASLPTATYNIKIENRPKAEIISYTAWPRWATTPSRSSTSR